MCIRDSVRAAPTLTPGAQLGSPAAPRRSRAATACHAARAAAHSRAGTAVAAQYFWHAARGAGP
eukprot:13299781-Alexandrium_andersonii.AAC.1